MPRGIQASFSAKTGSIGESMKIENEINGIKRSLSRLESRSGFTATLDKLLRVAQMRREREARHWQERTVYLERLLSKASSRLDDRTRAGSQVRTYNQEPRARVYQIKPGLGLEAACFGYDFDSPATLDYMRRRFADCLQRYSSMDADEAVRFANQFNHSWEIARHAFDPPDPDRPCAWVQVGRACLDGIEWRGALDPDPESESRRLYQNAVRYRESQQQRGGFSYKRLKEVEDDE